VNPAPAPAISGLSLVCDNESEDYSTDDNAGSSYEWTVTGGTIIFGAGTHLVSILWGAPGTASISVTETNADGCSATAEALNITIDDCTGLDEGLENHIRVYPNPATDRVTLQGLNNATVTLYDIPGKDLMAYRKVTGSLEMELTSFQKGIYLLKIEQVGTVNTIRLVKR
jgi:hypothetical protein